ncbi:XRE family transcriptional regulator [Paenibacillus alvei]|uniref:HTH cro/C1-type domain-containing protein n=1 Tax=Paenibacillus alvei TaxID=44250 RepID=A0A383R6Z7_PAEAL|nr:XRE family transcriptional regulator [Paenibacillus alvei]SYX82149.1 conserved protein of unknown function [Paenibacillus alvei]
MGVVKPRNETLGELIRRYRDELNMTQQELANRSGVNNKRVSFLEYGGAPRDYAILQSIFSVLHIPTYEVVTALANTKIHSEIWLSFLQQLVSSEDDISLAREVMVHLMASQDKNSEVGFEKLLSIVQQGSGNLGTRLELMDEAIMYAQRRGLQTYVAKGLFYRYLVERDDFSKMEETYHSGKKVLACAEDLASEDRIILYYKLGVHAFTLYKYNESIELGKLLLACDKTESTYKAYSILLISTSYYYKSHFELAEQYLNRIHLTRFPFLRDHVSFMKSKLHEQRGETESDYLEEDFSNPMKINELANYYINKGKVMSGINRQKEAIDYFKKGISMFTRLTETDEALLRQLEQTRLNMISAVADGRNLTDATVVRLSQELDGYIVEFQKKSILKRAVLTT